MIEAMARWPKSLSTLRTLALTGVAWVGFWGLALPSAIAEEPTEAEDTEEQPAEEYKNVLRWATASEVDNFGYHIYRGESEDGPFERVTKDPLLGAGTTDETSQYEFVDREIDPYATYWYYVESISKNGKRERFTPVFKTAPQIKTEESEAEESDAEPAADDSEPN